MKPFGVRGISLWENVGRVTSRFFSSFSFQRNVSSYRSTSLRVLLPYPGILTMSPTLRATASITANPLEITTKRPMSEMSPPVAYRVWSPIGDIICPSRRMTLQVTKAISQMRSAGSPSQEHLPQTLLMGKPIRRIGMRNGVASSRRRPMAHISIPMSKSFETSGMNF